MRPFVRTRAFLPYFATISALLAPTYVAHADDATPSTSTQPSPPTDEERFRKLKAEGDRARAAGRLNDAIKAYEAALKIKEDPLVEGRYGFTLMMWDDKRLWRDAAMALNDAVAEAAGDSEAEREAFAAAYRRARRYLCKLLVITNDAKSDVDVGNGKFEATGSSFWTLMAPGKYELIARLEGHDDIRKPYECKSNAHIEINIDFPKPPPPPTETKIVKKETIKYIREPNAKQPANQVATPDSKARNGINGAVGTSIVFGVAESPAYGISLSGAYRVGNWSAMIGARGAYAFGPIEGNTIDAFIFTGMIGPCFRERWFSAYVFGSMNIVKWIPTTPIPHDFYIPARVMPGIGIGARGTYLLSSRIGLYGGGDVNILPSDVELKFAGQNGLTQVLNGGQFLLSISLGLELVP